MLCFSLYQIEKCFFLIRHQNLLQLVCFIWPTHFMLTHTEREAADHHILEADRCVSHSTNNQKCSCRSQKTCFLTVTGWKWALLLRSNRCACCLEVNLYVTQPYSVFYSTQPITTLPLTQVFLERRAAMGMSVLRQPRVTAAPQMEKWTQFNLWTQKRGA